MKVKLEIDTEVRVDGFGKCRVLEEVSEGRYAVATRFGDDIVIVWIPSLKKWIRSMKH